MTGCWLEEDLESREAFYEERLRHAYWQRSKSQKKIRGSKARGNGSEEVLGQQQG